MNWAKGRATKGRGASFKGALRYVLHDKGAATAERVGFLEMRNLATDDPHRAWHEMMTLCEAADDLKKRSGEKATGRKLKKPVYAFTLNWHEDDRPEPGHMRQTAEEALQALGMEHLQAVIVEHKDRPHRHVHVIVNLVHPDTGKAASLSNDEHKLDGWAHRYEVAQGVIRSPARRAKFEALEQGRKPPKRDAQAGSRSEWGATRESQSGKAKACAAAIRTALANRIADLKGRQAAGYQLRRSEAERLWKGYQADRKSTRDRYQPFIDAIYRPRDKGVSQQAMRDLQETMEWKELGRRQFRKRKAFSERERHLLGVVANAVRLHFAGGRKGGMTSLFMLAVSGARRRSAFEERQQTERQALRESQGRRRKGRADVLRAACRHELSQRATEFLKQRQATVTRHAGEIAAQKAEWRAVAAERENAWADFKREFGQSDQMETGRDNSVRQTFNGASSGSPVDSGKAKDGDGRSESGGRGDGGGVAPKVKDQKPGWRARRKAADRKEDGTYKSRTRGGKDPGRTRRPTR